jgi:hypothetical protein
MRINRRLVKFTDAKGRQRAGLETVVTGVQMELPGTAIQSLLPDVSSSAVDNKSYTNGIVPACPFCGKELCKVISGLVCIEGCGPIYPLDEYCDSSVMPVNHKACAKIQQVPTDIAASRIGAAQRRLERLERREP